LNIIFSLIYTIFFAFLIDSVIFFILPNKNIFIDKNEINQRLDYKRFNLIQAFKKELVVKKTKPKPKPVIKEYPFLQNITLKAIFKITQKNGYIMISQKGKIETILLNVGDDFKGFRLTKLYDDYVIFIKNNKNYKLELNKNKKVDFNIVTANTDKTNTKQDNKIVDNDDYKSVRRDLINSYIKNPKKIWSNISINEYRKNGKIIGFKVYGVKRGSVFEKLGLKRGDIIIKVNNIELNSIKSAFDIYNKVKNKEVTSLSLIVLRNNNEMELDYEIE